MKNESSDKFNYDYDVCLGFHEGSALHAFLHEFFCKVDQTLKHLFREKYENIRALLHAHFGLKSTLLGLKRVKPFKLYDYEDVEKKLSKLSILIITNEMRSRNLYQFYIELSKHFQYPYIEFKQYEDPAKDLEILYLKYTYDDFTKLGISMSIEEFEKIIRFEL